MYGLFTSKPELRPSGFESEVTGVKPEGKLDNPDSLHTPLLTRMECSILRTFQATKAMTNIHLEVYPKKLIRLPR